MHIIKARYLPRRFNDALRVMVVGLVQFTALLIAPSLIVAAFFGSLLAGLVTFFGLYLAVALFTVREIRLSDKGIEFVRVCGFPKEVAWGQVVSIELVSVREGILKGWLWPMFPAREMTPSLTSVGQYRIGFDGGFAYYPPRSANEFERQITKELRPRASTSVFNRVM